MPLKRALDQPYVGSDGIYFRMEDHTGKWVTCSVTHALIGLLDGKPAHEASRQALKQFSEIRRHAEVQASALYDAGHAHPRIEELDPALRPPSP